MLTEIEPCAFCQSRLTGPTNAGYFLHPKNRCVLSEHEVSRDEIGAWNRRTAPDSATLDHIRELATCGMSHGLLADDYCRQILEVLKTAEAAPDREAVIEECAIRAAVHSQYPITTDFDRGYDKARKDAAASIRSLKRAPTASQLAALDRLAENAHELGLGYEPLTPSDPPWKPIETAPKDGREVLLFLGAPWLKAEKARWYEPWQNWQCGVIPDDPAREELHGIGSSVPTHWMPMPAAPTDASYCDRHCKKMCQNSIHGVCDGAPTETEVEKS
jgi:hypothetical protein